MLKWLTYPFQKINSILYHAGEWTSYPDMLQAETSPASVECRGRIYVFKNYVQVFDLALHTWSYLELSPGIPGHPLCTHPDPEGRSIYVSCLGAKSLWQVSGIRLHRCFGQFWVDFYGVSLLSDYKQYTFLTLLTIHDYFEQPLSTCTFLNSFRNFCKSWLRKKLSRQKNLLNC